VARLSSRLTYANVMATIAVFVALGGSGYAAVRLSKNSVTSRTIKNGQVKTADLAKNAVTSVKVTDGSLLATDFKPGQLPGGPAGPAGPTGAKGDAGAKGDTGAQGAVGPTAGFESGGSSTPAASPGTLVRSTSVTLPTPGRLFVISRLKTGLSCNSGGACTDTYALYVDGQAVPDSAATISTVTNGATSDQITTFGVTDALAAGSHSIVLAVTHTANWGSSQFNDSSLDAILLGG
jgi:hypothetical protein